MMLMGAVFYVCARPFAHLFVLDALNVDPRVVPLAVAYLKISALSEPFLAFGMILTGALNGAGDTKAPAVISILTMWGVRLPFAYLLAQHWHYGTLGAWWAMAASTILGGIAAYWLFKRGDWKRTVI